MRYLAALVLFLGLASGTSLALVPPSDSPFTFPTDPAPPSPPPPPKPVPGSVPILTKDVFYVVGSKTDALVRPHPAELVKVTKEAGPIKIRGVFYDGGGKVETRSYSEPFVFIVEPVGTGRVEIDFIPVKASPVAEKDIVQQTIDVNSGQAPIPPPIPIPVDDPLLKALQAAYDGEPAAVTVQVTGQPSQTFTKAQDKTSLAAVLRAMSLAILDPSIRNGDDHFAVLTNSTNTRIGTRLKMKLRPTIGAELDKIIPSGKGAGPIALTDQNRKDASALYLKVATLLDQVK